MNQILKIRPHFCQVLLSYPRNTENQSYPLRQRVSNRKLCHPYSANLLHKGKCKHCPVSLLKLLAFKIRQLIYNLGQKLWEKLKFSLIVVLTSHFTPPPSLNVDQMAWNCFQCHSTLIQGGRGSVLLISEAKVKELIVLLGIFWLSQYILSKIVDLSYKLRCKEPLLSALLGGISVSLLSRGRE